MKVNRFQAARNGENAQTAGQTRAAIISVRQKLHAFLLAAIISSRFGVDDDVGE